MTNATLIQGWMDPDELDWLARIARYCDGVAVEVGSWKGRSTRALADNMQGRVYAVDHWKGSSPELWQEVAERGPDSIFEDFQSNLSEHIARGQVIPLRMDARQGAVELLRLERTVDFVFLDADHTYEGVMADIESYRPLVREGGILAGHDYGNPQWPGVQQAVDEVFKTVNRDALSIWWVRL